MLPKRLRRLRLDLFGCEYSICWGIDAIVHETKYMHPTMTLSEKQVLALLARQWDYSGTPGIPDSSDMEVKQCKD